MSTMTLGDETAAGVPGGLWKDTSTQTDNVFSLLDPNYLVANQVLSLKVAALQEEVDNLKNLLSRSPLHLIMHNDQKTKLFTSLPKYDVFKALFCYLEPKVQSARQKETVSEATGKGKKRKLDLLEEFLAEA